MIVASGYIEVDNIDKMEQVAGELRSRRFEVGEMAGDRIVFLVERETAAQARADIDALQQIEGAKSVNLAYFSFEGADQS